jgi:5S rRNA maturation endonuclease (ribonuclease M5)
MRNDKLTKIKQNLQLYSGYVSLTKKGVNKYVGHCPVPFHDDKNPSFEVTEKAGSYVWHCFPCEAAGRNKGGSIIGLVMAVDNCDKRTAICKLEEKLGVQEVPDPPETSEPPSGRPKITKVSPLSGAVQKFVKARGISAKVAEDYGLMAAKNGTVLAIPYEGVNVPENTFQFRSVAEKKFWVNTGLEPEPYLFGIDQPVDPFKYEVHLTEGPLDALVLASVGLRACAVKSAGARPEKLDPEHLEFLKNADKVYLWLDQDDEGEKCAQAFKKELRHNAVRIQWDRTPKEKAAKKNKDAGDLYQQDPEGFKQRVEALVKEADSRPPEWMSYFDTVDDSEDEPVRVFIDEFLQEGVTFIGAASGVGKTWLCLSMAKALTTGKDFLGQFKVPKVVPVVYLIPEDTRRKFKSRARKMRLRENFFYRTITNGLTRLTDQNLLDAVEKLKPVVFLDTAIRFSEGESENAASDNNKHLAANVFKLLSLGAQAVVCVHHRPKNSVTKEMTLENTLRGTGDFGAMSDMVYGLGCTEEDKKALKFNIRCVKARDAEPMDALFDGTFCVQGRPYIFGTREK